MKRETEQALNRILKQLIDINSELGALIFDVEEQDEQYADLVSGAQQSIDEAITFLQGDRPPEQMI